MSFDRFGSVVLEDILRLPRGCSPILGELGRHETVVVGAWYIWWERREACKGESAKLLKSTAFAIHAIIANTSIRSDHAQLVKGGWDKPLHGSYKLNTDASFFKDGSGAIAAIL